MPASPAISAEVARRREKVRALRKKATINGRPLSLWKIGQLLGVSPQVVANDLRVMGKSK